MLTGSGTVTLALPDEQTRQISTCICLIAAKLSMTSPAPRCRNLEYAKTTPK